MAGALLACAACGVRGDSTKLKVCAGCHAIWYCSRPCQKDGWKVHKASCKKAQGAPPGLSGPQVTMCSDASAVGSVALVGAAGGGGSVIVCSEFTRRGGDGVAGCRDVERAEFTRPGDLRPALQFLLACGRGLDLDAVQRLAPQLDVNATRLPGVGFTGLEWAARCGNLEVVRWLCGQGGADPRVGTPMLWACYANHLAVAKELHLRGADHTAVDDTCGASPLQMAASNGALECVKWLVGMDGGLLHQMDKHGRRPWHYALDAYRGHPEGGAPGPVRATERWLAEQGEEDAMAA